MADFKTTFEQLLARSNTKPRRKRPSSEEHELQVACVQWFRYQYPQYDHNLFAVPNGGKRDKVTAGKLKAEGQKAGISDLVLLKANKHHHALLIEMKTSKGRLSQAQAQWRNLITRDGFRYAVCRSLEEFIETINNYLNN